jgi:hypothetical protein
MLAQIPQHPIDLEGSHALSQSLQFLPDQLNRPDGVCPDLNLLKTSRLKADLLIHFLRQGWHVMQDSQMTQHLR